MTTLRIKKLAKDKNLNISDLMHATGLAYTTVSRLYHGTPKQFSLHSLDCVAFALGVRVPDLFEGDPTPDPSPTPPTDS